MSATCFAVAGKLTKKDVDRDEYRCLVSKALPHVIQNEAENEHYIRTLEILDAKSNPTAAESALADLLTMLIEGFEEKHYALRKASPLENLHGADAGPQTEAKGPRRCLWYTEYRFRSSGRQTPSCHLAHSETERPFSCSGGVVSLIGKQNQAPPR